MNLPLSLTINFLTSIAILLTVGCAEKQHNSSAKIKEVFPENIQFVCSKTYDEANKEYVYATKAWKPPSKRTIILWEREDFSGNGFTSQKRCEEVSPRFQEAYENGNLKYLTEGKMNGQPVICTAEKVGNECSTLLITLKHQDHARQTLGRLSDIFLGYASGAIVQSSGEIAYSDDNRMFIKVDIEEFLSKPE